MKPRHVIAAAALATGLGVPAIAFADSAYTTGNVNMRAGPSTEFPRLTMLPAGAEVTIHGCTYGWSWCDTGWRGLRGWVSARYLQHLYEGRRVDLPDYATTIGLPIVTFEFTTYWNRWYRDRPWYRERDRWYSEWMGGDRVDRVTRSQARQQSSAGIVSDAAPRSRRSPADTPPGIRKKGPGFCPPGQAKKGRC
jgi:uncharacterized protein YraI